MLGFSHSKVVQHLKEEFQNIGYVGNLLRENYAYADVLSPSTKYTVRHIPLAAFSQYPPSYRTASFGVTFSNGRSGAEFIQDYKSLGAPQILEIGTDQVFRWKVAGTGNPVLLGKVGLSSLPELFAHHKDDWAPQRILRAKSANSEAIQLDFLDLGLLPLLDSEVRKKLDRLLRETIDLAIDTFENNSPFAEEHYPPLFRLVFRLIASKILADRNYPGQWDAEEPQSAISAVEKFYFSDYIPEPVLEDYRTQEAIWQRIKNTFHFQNLSVDSLAYVYENTLVTRETRKSFGIHSTPPAIAEYIVRRLPFDDLDRDDRQVFEPFSGHSVFLVAAMQRMRDLLPPDLTSDELHQYFVEMLSGIEIDPFAREVARLSLMLADYPNPNGWNLHQADVLTSPLFYQELEKANIVLCNPPFEKFSADERATYSDLSSPWKPAEILNRVLQNPPKLLGFVLPRVFLVGGSYRNLRSLLGSIYSSIEVLALPDNVFQHSEAKAVLLISSGQNQGTVHLRTGEVYRREWDDFNTVRRSWSEVEREVENASKVFLDGMWLPPLDDVWQATTEMARLDDFASIHRGIEYNLPIARNKARLVAQEDYPGFVLGVHKVKGAVEPFVVTKPVFLNMDVSFLKPSGLSLPWNEPKLIVNSNRQSRAAWKISASVDFQGLVCFRNFHGIWPKGELALEVLAAVLNGPVANAYMGTHGEGRYIRIATLKDIPVPEFTMRQQQIIASLVHQYVSVRESWLQDYARMDEKHDRCLALMHAIDAEVLKAYDLEPRLERMLLDYFNGDSRLGPVEFTGYFPPDFNPHIPWHQYISRDFKEATAKETLHRLPVIAESPLIGQALSHLE